MRANIHTHKDAGNKVLIVDQKPDYYDSLSEILADQEIDLYYAHSAHEGLALSSDNNFVLIIIHTQLPEMDGYAMAEIFCMDDKMCHVPFIFILPEGTKMVKLFNGHEKGLFTFLSEPINAHVLIDKVKYFIEKYRHEQELVSTRQVLKEHIKEIQKAYDDLKSFSYTVSHDLRAPLRIISGYSTILQEDYGHILDVEGSRVIDTIVRNASKMTRLIDELLNYAKLSRQDKHLEYIDMTENFASIFEELTDHILNNRITLQLSEVKPAYADKTLVRRLITNLISNAVKYSAPKRNPVIEVGGFQDGDEYVYYVKDNGVGFNPEYKDKVFGVFQRLHKDSEFEGTGIGLAIASKVVDHHNGRIWAEASPGKGAEFYFTLERKETDIPQLSHA